MADIQVRATKNGQKRYRVRYRDRTGRQVVEVYGREAQARAAKAAAEVASVKGRLPDKRAGQRTFRELWDDHHAERDLAAATLGQHGYVWEHVKELADLPVNRIDAARIDRTLAKIPGPSMRSKSRAVLRPVFADAVADDAIPSNPAVSRRRSRVRGGDGPRKTPRALTRDEVAALAAEVPDRYRALVLLAAGIGLRPGEVRALTVGQVDLLRRKVTIDRSAAGPTKTGRIRHPVLSGAEAEMLAEHIARYSDPADPDALVFRTRAGTALESGGLRRVIETASRRAGLPRVRPNDLRHSAASQAIADGGDPVTVAELLGHSTPRLTLETYGHAFDSALRRLADRRDAAAVGETDPEPAAVVRIGA